MSIDPNKPMGLDEAMNRMADDVDVYSVHEGKKVLDHVKVANALVKFLGIAPIDPIMRQIMVTRIGYPFSHNGEQISHAALGLMMGLHAEEVIEIEKAGVYLAAQFMDRVCAEDAIEAFNKDSKVQKEVRSTLMNEET